MGQTKPTRGICEDARMIPSSARRHQPPPDSLLTVLADAIAAELRNLRQGFIRLGLGLFALWFLFWTLAYVIHPFTSLRSEPTFAVRVTAWSVIVPCLTSAVIFAGWIVAGFRPNPDNGQAQASLTRARLRVRLSEIFNF
jgi:hypothetical protein